VLPNLSVLWVILIVLLTTVLLDRLMFRPLFRVMAVRDENTASARAVADKAAAEAAAAAAEFEAKTTAARAEVYREMDQTRRDALARRAELLVATRREGEEGLARAGAQLAADAAAARERLSADAEEIGREIAERVLGRKVS
jgi:F0F1-type ATP synthase membrane subunit b/b'